MKKTIIILIILCFSGILKAQNNLEFSKVIKLSGENFENGDTETSLIVPRNKVWKITSGTVKYGYGEAFIDNHFIDNSCSSCFPLWLPEGTHIIQIYGLWSISGIEFNIVQ